MIIVMTDGNTNDFENELLKECIPFIEKISRVKANVTTVHWQDSLWEVSNFKRRHPQPRLFCLLRSI